MPRRSGAILGRDRILKRDQYPGLHQDPLQQSGHPRIEGAPNYRHAEGTDIHGLGQPTVAALRAVLEKVRESGSEPLWINLREEPVLYVDGQPFCLRDRTLPFNNLTATGIQGRSLEKVEENLRRELLEEARCNGGRVVLHDEGPGGRIYQREVEITPDLVKTPRQVFDEVKAEGYPVSYHRVPLTDERTPEPQDFDELFRLLRDHPAGAPQIFNCHAGKGRTTTGMIVADLVSRREELSPPRRAAESSIDRFDQVQNLRRAVVTSDPNVPGQTRDYLERYVTVLRFSEYLHEGGEQSFSAWLGSRTEFHPSMCLLERALDAWHRLPLAS